MKRFMVVLAAMALVIAMVGGAFAADTTFQNVTATATVTGICKNGTDGTLTFGTIDPSSTDPVNATSSGLTYKCSNGTTFNISELASTGAGTTGTCAGYTGTMKSTGTPDDELDYTATCTAGPYTGTGFSVAVNVPITGTVTSAQYQDAKPHNDYTDTLKVTISY